jgi:hypothetical protein
MTGKAFLHPSQRVLKTEQIGPSSHRNQYHVGVLDGNWFEERTTFGASSSRGSFFNAASTHRVSYPPRTSAEIAQSRPPAAVVPEAPRELMFGHGPAPVRSQYSVSELSFQVPDESTAVRGHHVAEIEGISPRRHRSDAKRSEAMSSMGETTSLGGTEESLRPPYRLPPIGAQLSKERFTTTKNVTIDAAGEFLREHREAYVPRRAGRSEFLRTLTSVMRKTGLRQ